MQLFVHLGPQSFFKEVYEAFIMYIRGNYFAFGKLQFCRAAVFT